MEETIQNIDQSNTIKLEEILALEFLTTQKQHTKYRHISNISKIDNLLASLPSSFKQTRDYVIANFAKGKIFYFNKVFDMAQKQFNLCIDCDVDFGPAYFFLALICMEFYYQQNDQFTQLQNGTYYLKISLQKAPRNYHQISLIKKALSIENARMQKQYFQEAMDCDPKKTPIEENQELYKPYVKEDEWALVLHYFKNDQSGYNYIENLLQNDPNNKMYLLYKGKILYAQKLYTQANECFQKAIDIDEHFHQAYSYKAISSAKLKDLNSAISLAYRSVNYQPNNAQYLYRLAAIHYELGMYLESQLNVNLSIKNDPEFAFSHLYQGKLLQKQNKHVEAIECFKKALSLYDSYVEIYFNMGASFFLNKQYQQALECYEIGLQKSPENTRAYLDIALTLYRLGRFNQSTKRFVEACLKDERNMNYLKLINYNDAAHITNIVSLTKLKQCTQKKILYQMNHLKNSNLWKKILRKEINMEISEFLIQNCSEIYMADQNLASNQQQQQQQQYQQQHYQVLLQ